jgi:hypothetical protein
LVINMTSRGSAFWAGFFRAVSALVCGCVGKSNQTTQQRAPSALSYAQAQVSLAVGEAISPETLGATEVAGSPCVSGLQLASSASVFEFPVQPDLMTKWMQTL